MKHRAVLLSLVAVVSISALGLDVLAAPPPKPPAAPAPPADAPAVANLTPMLEQFKWGMTHLEVGRVHNQTGGIFDQDYNPQLARLQPGVQMQALEAEREQKKLAFTASYVEFRDTPTGFDNTGIKGEYTYRNKESVMYVDRGNKRRYFFFIGAAPGDKLWKIYDEVKLADGQPYGKSYQEAVTKLNVTLNTPARIRAANAAQDLSFTTSDWQDATTHLRSLDRTRDGVVAIVLEDRATLGALPNLRTAKIDDPFAIDPTISAATRGVGRQDPSAARDAGTPDAAKKR
ncbi:hypothetical protein BH09MYX1_BH09MYX1_46490 [soil metagenome]